MNWGEIKKRKMPVAIVLIVVTFLVYIPFFIFFLNVREDQLKNGEEPKTVLPVYGSDSIGYGILGNAILHKGVFSTSNESPYKPDTFRTPGYPLLLVAFIFLFGSYTFFPIVQILFVIGTAWLIFKIGLKLFSFWVGLIAALFFIIDPAVILHTLLILSDITFTFFLILSVYLMFFYEKKNPWIFFLSGLSLAVATYIRPIAMFVPFVILPFYLYLNWSHQWKTLLRNAGLFVAALILILSPWVVRNKIVSNTWGLSSVQSFNFFFYTMPEFLSFKEKVSPDDIRKKFFEEMAVKGVKPEDFSDLSVTSKMNEISYPYLKSNLPSYAVWHAVKMTPFFFSSGIKNFFYVYDDMIHYKAYETSNSNLTNFLMRGQFKNFFNVIKGQALITIEQLFWVFVFILMFVPLWIKEKRFYTLLLLALIFYLALPTVPVAYSRFRIPAAPFMFILAVEGFLILLYALKRTNIIHELQNRLQASQNVIK
ncbi:MAG: glycosyltransferase family 39 protein [Candidatus Paceibacterota bacterium]